ncbi:hypothetical protein TIFTF001_043672 [Ficus carica]|uniref:Uncharacterized protein n=1 Tax=Ficus carica TaxID=3494 RepID=A0AA87Z0S1_FICCA|nr:hypothetical protein TIFTF001_043672 [Ficus carica]
MAEKRRTRNHIWGKLGSGSSQKFGIGKRVVSERISKRREEGKAERGVVFGIGGKGIRILVYCATNPRQTVLGDFANCSPTARLIPPSSPIYCFPVARLTAPIGRTRKGSRGGGVTGSYGVIGDNHPSSRCCGCRRARDVVDAGELVMLWMPARGLVSPSNLTAPRTTHVALRPGCNVGGLPGPPRGSRWIRMPGWWGRRRRTETGMRPTTTMI